MEFWLGISGLVLNLFGAVLIALADRSFSWWVDTSLLALELNVARIAQLLRRGGSESLIREMDIHRDRAQERSRLWKLVGWLVLIAGYLFQVAAISVAWSHAS
jgi:hypothetical protein